MKRFFFYLLLLVSTVSFAQKNNINLIRGTTFYSTWTVTGDYTSYSSLIFKVNLGNNQYLQRAVTQSYVSPTTTLRCTLYVNDTQDLNPGDYLFNIYAFGADTLVLVSAYMKLTKNVALDPVPITFPRYTVIPIDTPNTANTFIVGQDSNNVWYRKSVDQTRAILNITDDTTTINANFDSLYTKLSSSTVYVMDYVATHDTTNGWQGAIQAAIDAVKSNSTTGLIAWHNMGNTMTQVVLPAKYMTITEPIKMYSAITLVGQGASSEIVEGAGFVGKQLIEMVGGSGDNNIDHLTIKNLTLTTTTVRGIGYDDNVGYCVNSFLEGIILNSVQGIILDKYTQYMAIRDIYSYGYIDTLLFLYGNFNLVEDVDKEGNTGTAPGAYIYLKDLVPGAGGCSSNVLRHILLEGGSANKTGIILSGAGGTNIYDLWWEVYESDGYMMRIEGGEYNYLHGRLGYIHSEWGRIKVDSTQHLTIESFSTAAEGSKSFSERIEKDSLSTVYIKNTISFGQNDNPYSLENIDYGYLFDRSYSRIIYTSNPAGYKPESKLNNMSASNWLINGSFEAGKYGWTCVADTIEPATSEVDKGLMLRVLWNDTTSYGFVTQDVTIPSALIGKALTFSAIVNATAGNSEGSGWVYPYIDGCGITGSNLYNRAFVDSGWAIVTQTFIPQSAGTLTVGIGTVNILEYYVDDCNLSTGTETILNSDRTGSLELNTNSMTYASSAPTTGTWKQGDVVFNSTTDNEGYIGWVCTSAGTPGTWVQFGGTIETRGGLYEKAITITPTNSTSYALTVNNTMKVSGYTYGYHELRVPLLNMTTEDSVSIFYTTAERMIDSIRYKMDDSVAFNIKYGADGYGTEIFTTPDTLTGSGVITSFDESVIPANNEGQLYFKFLGDGAVKPWVHLYYHDYDTVNVYAVNLNGTNEYAYKTSPSNLNFGDSSATILTWFNISAVNTEPRIISNRIINAGYEIYLQNDSSFNVFIGGASYRTIKVNGAKPTIGSWVLGALVLDQANDSVRVHFIDNSVMYENKDTNTYVINPSSTLAIGRYSSASQNFFDGKIGETQIITGKALTRAEIMAAYTQTLNGEHFDASYSGGTIVAWYKWSGDNDTGFLDDTSPTLGGNDLTGVNVDKAGDQVIINGGYK